MLTDKTNYIYKLLILSIFNIIPLSAIAEVTEGNVVPSGSVQLQCWQYGNKIIDEKGLNQQTISSIGEPGFMRFHREKEPRNMVFLVPTNSAICLIKSEDR